ncbi:histone H2A [Mortierella claussenii]|nr:histone H2A [Mortierella claussenii]
MIAEDTRQDEAAMLLLAPEQDNADTTQDTVDIFRYATVRSNSSYSRGKNSGSKFSSGRSRPQSRSSKSGLQFPVGRLHRQLRDVNYAHRIGAGAPVYLAAVLEYLCAEILELAGNAARDNRKMRIIPRHLQLANRSDDELNKLLSRVTIAQGGVLPNIHDSLLLKKKKGQSQQSNQEP